MPDIDRQNLVIGLGVPAALLFLLWAGSHSEGIVFLLSTVAFAFLGLTNYALIHEASHHNLHSERRVNNLLGALAGWLFPASFSFLEVTHQAHHRNNRTDGEMFDYYYPDDNLLIKYAQWYSILVGFYPPIIPAGSLLMALVPGVFRLKPWRVAKSSSILFDRGLFNDWVVRKIRSEVLLGLCFWVAAWLALDLDPLSVLILYAAFWFNWSTRQYVTHAFSPRDVVNGAWNLTVSRLMGGIFLNGQWDLVHHNHPHAHWQELPELGKASRPPSPYWRQYLSLWAGPRPNPEPAPVALDGTP
ncbi:MAG: fatty acid desaturase [Pseudomonadota bacterium]|nr:fatty acid desaturase [Pseudomonadota bacterium]